MTNRGVRQKGSFWDLIDDIFLSVHIVMSLDFIETLLHIRKLLSGSEDILIWHWNEKFIRFVQTFKFSRHHLPKIFPEILIFPDIQIFPDIWCLTDILNVSIHFQFFFLQTLHFLSRHLFSSRHLMFYRHFNFSRNVHCQAQPTTTPTHPEIVVNLDN